RDGEGGAMAGRRVDADLAAEAAGEALNDVEAEADAGSGEVAAIAALAEGFEDRIDLRRLDADAGVADIDLELVGAPVPARADADHAAAGVLAGVLEQVAEDRAQLLLVGAQRW